jgi:hypothetical protein
LQNTRQLTHIVEHKAMEEKKLDGNTWNPKKEN